MTEVYSGLAGQFGPWTELIPSTEHESKHLGVVVEERGTASLEVEIGIGRPGFENMIASIDIDPAEPHHIKDPYSLTPNITIPKHSRVSARLKADQDREPARVAVKLI